MKPCRKKNIASGRPWHLNLIVFATVLCVMPYSALAQRWYGNVSLLAQKSQTVPAVVPKSGLYVSRALINVEDVIFYKTRFRFAGNFSWRDDMYTAYREYRPIYYGFLSGYGYELNSSLSPFSRLTSRTGDSTGSSSFKVYNREWRTALAVNIPKFPTLNLVFNRYSQFDREPIPTYNSQQRTWVIESGFQRNLYSLRGNYNRRKRDNHVTSQVNDVVRSANGTVSALTPLSELGNASATYNFYDTKRTLAGADGDASQTHSLALMASSAFIKKLNATASYSGRFTQSSTRFSTTTDTRAETISGSLAYAPTNYAELQTVKAYQLEGTGSQHEISEYVTLSAIFSRYLRRGVDTRIAMTRTLYQQSSRVVEYRDTLGNVDSTNAINHFAIDTWYGSVNFSPEPYVRTNATYSVSRDSKPISIDRKYQSTGAIDARLSVTEQIEARLGYTSIYLGERLRLGHAFSDNWNLGANWMPRQNLNISLTYTYSKFNSSVTNTNGNISAYASYSFRRAFSCYLSYGRQEQTQIASTALPGIYTTTTARPESWNSQLLIYTGKRSTLTLGYVRSSGKTDLNGANVTTETFQGTLNLQL